MPRTRGSRGIHPQSKIRNQKSKMLMKPLLAQLLAAKPLSTPQAVEAFELIMTGQATPAQIASLLSLIEARGATVDELVGAATVMRAKSAAVKVPEGLRVVDTCGAGGTHSRTFNISTAAALVAGAAGRPRNVVVAKHGNRSVTSASGSSQVLEALGVKLEVKPETLTRCLDDAGFCFCFAPAHHPATRFAVPIRAELGFRTIFNLLGPLTNPAGAQAQVMGVPLASLTQPIAQVLQKLGAEHAMVVHSALPGGGAMGELMTTGPTQVSHLRDGRIDTYEFDPRTFNLPVADLEDLCIDGPAASARVVDHVLTGQPGPARDIVLLNAAAALLVADLVNDINQGLQLAAEAIDNGDANRALQSVIQITQSE
jgi:anthranilate phosphoribosyltransferase